MLRIFYVLGRKEAENTLSGKTLSFQSSRPLVGRKALCRQGDLVFRHSFPHFGVIRMFSSWMLYLVGLRLMRELFFFLKEKLIDTSIVVSF